MKTNNLFIALMLTSCSFWARAGEEKNMESGIGRMTLEVDGHAQAKAILQNMLDQAVKKQEILGMVMAVRLANGSVLVSAYICIHCLGGRRNSVHCFRPDDLCFALFAGMLVSKETLEPMSQPVGTEYECAWGLGCGEMKVDGHKAFAMGGDITGYHAFFVSNLDAWFIVTALVNTEKGNVLSPCLAAPHQYISGQKQTNEKFRTVKEKIS